MLSSNECDFALLHADLVTLLADLNGALFNDDFELMFIGLELADSPAYDAPDSEAGEYRVDGIRPP